MNAANNVDNNHESNDTENKKKERGPTDELHEVTIDTARFSAEDTLLTANDNERANNFNSSLITVAHSSSCDRRLSRAARSLLLRHLRSILLSSPTLSRDPQQHQDALIDYKEASLWQLLEASLVANANNNNNNNNNNNRNNNCPLIPSRDIFRWHEDNTIVLSPPPKTAQTRIGVSIRSAIYTLTKRMWQSATWYQCGLCGKLFSSRYYLDLHLDHHHAHQLSKDSKQDNNINSWICPATSWCPALPSCAQHALELEPYYGPGSGGLSFQDRYTVHRTLWKEAHPELYESPCNEESMRQSRHACYQMMRDCFLPSPTNDHPETAAFQNELHHRLEQSLCERISCPDRLHQLFFAATAKSNDATAIMMKTVHEWNHEWQEYYEEHHSLGRMGVALLIGLAVWYTKHLRRAVLNRGTNSNYLRRSKDLKGTRLLQKKRSSSSSLIERTRKSLLQSSSSSSKTKVH